MSDSTLLQIRELRPCGETIIEIANMLVGMFYSQAAEDTRRTEVPKRAESAHPLRRCATA